jgi:hypothetical protein
VASARSFGQAAFVAFTVLFLLTALWGWLRVEWSLLRGGEIPPWAGPAAQISSTVAVASFTALLGFKQMGWLRPPSPQILVSIVRAPEKKREGATEDPWQVRATIAVRPGRPPLRVRTFTGIIEPLYAGAPVVRAPVLLKPEPDPLDVAIKEFTYLVESPALPPEGQRHRLTFFLVSDEGTTKAVINAHHGGGYTSPGILQRMKDSLWLRKGERKQKRAWKALWRDMNQEARSSPPPGLASVSPAQDHDDRENRGKPDPKEE